MRHILTGFALLALLLAAGCTSRITKENYDRLKTGMKYEEVTAILGKPASCSETMGVSTCTWGDENKNVTVIFLADSATAFAHQGLR